MCCFSRSVRDVSSTEIFARSSPRGQYLVYRMSVALEEDLAMILPLPVPPASPDDAVRFIDLSGYDDFFKDLDAGFPQAVSGASFGRAPAAQSSSVRKLEVHTVGSFEASFVPARADFARLDERFRLPPATWDGLPAYADYGFAVFKLRHDHERGIWSRLRGGHGKKSFHPMAFEFPRRDARALFFPTVHVHDGVAHPEATFDHTLYLQADEGWEDKLDWERSSAPAAGFARCDRAASILAPGARVHRTRVRGPGRNRDVIVHHAELDARSLRGALTALRFRLYYGAGMDAIGYVPDHPAWAREMAPRKRRVAEALLGALDRELAARRAAWEIVDFDPSLPLAQPQFHTAFPEATGPAGACRVEVPLLHPHLEPQALWASIAFASMPRQQRVDEISTEAKRLLERAFAEVAASSADA